MISNLKQINILTVKRAFEMLHNVMIKWFFWFVYDEQENKDNDFKNTILLLLKIERLDSFV